MSTSPRSKPDSTLILIDRPDKDDLPAGVSYLLGRVAVKAGYSLGRYFNAIDGGKAWIAKSYDCTIQGRYIKLSLGPGR